MSHKIIFTLDYEIHGNGDGSPLKLMVEPTYRLLNLLEKFNAKLTIFADIAELLRFKEYYQQTGEDIFHSLDIEKQLKEAIERGHDVQLHIHSSYMNAKYENNKWMQNWAEYDMTILPFNRIDKIINTCKNYLEALLQTVSKEYKCHAFRAANWSMMPTENIAKALLKNGITLDSSVYKWGRQSGNINYDYSNAHSNILSYRADIQNINLEDPSSQLMEYPIYSELRSFASFISLMRIFRMLRARFHTHQKNESAVQSDKKSLKNDRRLSISAFFQKHAWKLDFSQSSGRQMIHATRRIFKNSAYKDKNLTIVLIAHSKTFFNWNELQLKKYLMYIDKSGAGEFGLFNKNLNL